MGRDKHFMFTHKSKHIKNFAHPSPIKNASKLPQGLHLWTPDYSTKTFILDATQVVDNTSPPLQMTHSTGASYSVPSQNRAVVSCPLMLAWASLLRGDGLPRSVERRKEEENAWETESKFCVSSRGCFKVTQLQGGGGGSCIPN